MEAAEINSIVAGRHRDAFSVLGPHGNEIRAWLPNAKEAWVVTSTGAVEMERAHPSGFFIGKLKSPTDHYRLRSGTYEFDDPYCFPPLLTPFELYLHAEGTNHESYRTLGAHMVESEGVEGVRFAVWAPTAEVVSVIGDFNRWDRTWHPMRLREAGIWEIFIPGLGAGANYKYSVLARSGQEQQKCDPYGFHTEVPPKTASIVWSLSNHA
jgi:1,4-alpha-glucan branching enzyme